MVQDISISLFLSTLFLLSVNVFLSILKKERINRLVGFVTLLSAALSIFFVYFESGHLPMSGTFEKMQNIVFVIVILGFIYEFVNKNRKINFSEFWIIALIFQAIVFFDELKVDPMYYMYDNVFVALFFQLRLISMAVLSFSLAMYLTSFRLQSGSTDKAFMMHHAANFTLLGAILFIAGEFSGSMWAQLAYGDSWRWSKNFFTSGAMFLLTLLVSHIPNLWKKNKNLEIFLSIVPILIILVLFLV
ncbi:MAG: hypothetical protein JXR36_03900 [Bacteroidales bacterium]|nr:hypothetical protein [Bacteroidales bacterium]